MLASVPFVVVLWGWHLPAPYEAALGDHLVHSLEHLTMLATAMLSWTAIIIAARRRRHDRPGLAILVLFGLSTVSGLLGVLLTFAPDVLYRSYERTAPAWHLSALADQQLAGVIMWVPGGAVYLAVALVILIDWLSQQPTPRRRRQPTIATDAPNVRRRSTRPLLDHARRACEAVAEALSTRATASRTERRPSRTSSAKLRATEPAIGFV